MSAPLIFDGIRTPFGRHGGSLARVRPDNLVAATIRELVKRNNLSGSEIEDVILGNTNQAGEDSRNLGRHAALLANLPVEVPGMTVNRLCGSGLSAIIDAGRAIQTGQGNLFIAGGSEVMSRAPWVMARAETAFSRNQPIEDSTIGSRFANPKITEMYGNPSMAETADNVAADLDISREESDTFAYQSQQRYEAARSSGFFQAEILGIEVPGASRKAPPVNVDVDEHPRPEATVEKMATLRALNPGGVVTAGNASGINDGAASLLIGDEQTANTLGITPRARILSAAVAGVAPRVMGLGPVPASQKALDRAGLSLSDMDVIEINEAFAPQVLGCLKELGLGFDEARVNPNGGAIAVGHPLGASGARITLTAMRQLEATGGHYALVSMCIGVGQGIAAVIENINI